MVERSTRLCAEHQGFELQSHFVSQFVVHDENLTPRGQNFWKNQIKTFKSTPQNGHFIMSEEEGLNHCATCEFKNA